MKKILWICDFCSTEIKASSNFYGFELKVKHKAKANDFEMLMCEACFDKTTDTAPKGLLQRILGGLKFKF